MKFLFSINSHNLLLTATQVEAIADILHGSEMIEQKYMGSKAPKGSDYVGLIRPSVSREYLKMSVISDMEYDSLVFVTKQLDGV